METKRRRSRCNIGIAGAIQSGFAAYSDRREIAIRLMRMAKGGRGISMKGVNAHAMSGLESASNGRGLFPEKPAVILSRYSAMAMRGGKFCIYIWTFAVQYLPRFELFLR
jgi:hypothetical protein